MLVDSCSYSSVSISIVSFIFAVFIFVVFIFFVSLNTSSPAHTFICSMMTK